MADRVNVQVQFKKAVWTCPACGQEDIEDRPMEGGASYVHTCSKCGKEFNQSGPNMREYNGSINYTPEQYEALKSEDLAVEKKKRCDDWLYSVKNPPPYVEPKSFELIAEKETKLQEIQALDLRIQELQLKEARVAELSTKIEEKIG